MLLTAHERLEFKGIIAQAANITIDSPLATVLIDKNALLDTSALAPANTATGSVGDGGTNGGLGGKPVGMQFGGE